jgi:hypothetical protein
MEVSLPDGQRECCWLSQDFPRSTCVLDEAYHTPGYMLKVPFLWLCTPSASTDCQGLFSSYGLTILLMVLALFMVSNKSRYPYTFAL